MRITRDEYMHMMSSGTLKPTIPSVKRAKRIFKDINRHWKYQLLYGKHKKGETMKRFTSLASQIAKIEGKKSQARIGDIREILKIIVQLEAEFLLDDKQEFGPTDLLSEDGLTMASKLGKQRNKAKKK